MTRRRERHDCTCGGIAPGYPMHEFFCGRPEPYDPPPRQEQQMTDSSSESTTEDMWQRLRSAAQAASEATAELDAALKRLVAARRSGGKR